MQHLCGLPSLHLSGPNFSSSEPTSMCASAMTSVSRALLPLASAGHGRHGLSHQQQNTPAMRLALSAALSRARSPRRLVCVLVWP